MFNLLISPCHNSVIAVIGKVRGGG